MIDIQYGMTNKVKSMLDLEEKKEITLSQPVKENLPIEYEIECPHDVMTLQSEFDKVIYFCEERNFSLSLIPK
ncbi:hypothetical protein [Nitrososphaera sp. AFS]|uniref:hypothetical protein n=1 Tax=Nitrososphaera sp. AFS TaxID=2301191 RepID=UPI001F175801|nr:hypothetical protein [Nitrososphaera sp. AFS]NAL78161.1 hypothetical protein [Nitrososphaera sp. AFS]